MRGRKPVPTGVKRNRARNGRDVVGHRRVPDNEPAEDNQIFPPPDSLSKAARDLYYRVSQRMQEQGRLDSTHAFTIIAYAVAYTDWVDLEAQVRRQRVFADPAAKYQERKRLRKEGLAEKDIENQMATFVAKPLLNPLARERNEAFKQAHKCAVELGITPSSQTRVSVPNPTPYRVPQSTDGQKVVGFAAFVGQGRRR